MRAASLPLLLVAAGALVLAGCLGPSNAPPAQGGQGGQPEQPAAAQGGASQVTEPVRNATGPTEVLFPFKGHITLGAGADGVGYVTPTGSADAHAWTFKVAPNATAIVAELRWADATQDLDLELGTPDCDSTMGTGTCVFDAKGAPGSGDSPVKIVFTDPAALAKAGDWKLFVWGKDAVNADFAAAATVFYGAMPPEGYTALGGNATAV